MTVDSEVGLLGLFPGRAWEHIPGGSASNYQLPITNYQLPITNYQLPITNYQLPNLPITNY
ncbi:MAG: hypothetical protein HC786_30460, partial [Richelia sp. CSU_2_1]|nr:hypothetical protein [Richelia sp. CSU_2_1]